MRLTIAKDTLPQYIILYTEDTLKTTLVFNRSTIRTIQRIEPGTYTLMIVANDFSICDIPNLILKADQTLCIHTDRYPFQKNDALFDKVVQENNRLFNKPVTQAVPKTNNNNILPEYEHGNGNISGKVIDKKGGLGISGASVLIKGTKTGAATDANGQFSFHSIKTGTVRLVFSAVGYVSKEILVNVKDGIADFVNVSMDVSNQAPCWLRMLC